MKRTATYIMWICIFIIMISGCRTLHMAAGISYNKGNSGGCPERTGTGIQVETAYYLGMKNGVGAGIRFFTPGFTDCNDGDPLLFMIPQAKFRYFLVSDQLAFDAGAGYAMGVFVDRGYQFSAGLNYYPNNWSYVHMEHNYYEAFNPKQNAIMPGTSSNSSTQLTLGIYIK